MLNQHPHLSPSYTPNDVLKSRIGNIFIYDTFLIINMHEGVVVNYLTAISLLLKVLRKIGTKPIVAISDRKNSYSLDPNDYKHLNKIPNLKGYAIVYHNEFSYNNALLESNFIKRPFKVFDNLNDAVRWANALLEND